MKKRALLFTTCSLIFLFSGCGYSTTSTLPSQLRTIHVEEFVNNISFESEAARRNLYLPLLEVDARDAIVDRFLFNGRLKITNSDMADLILKGILKNYRRTGLRFTDNDDVEEYRIYIVVGLELWDNRNQEMMWQEPNFVGEATYFVTGSEAVSEETAVEEAIEDLARRIVERTLEDW